MAFYYFATEFEFAEPPNRVSTLGGLPVNPDFDSLDPFRDFLTNDISGYAQMIRTMVDQFLNNIRFNADVIGIDYNTNNIVTLLDNGSCFISDFVINTMKR